MQTHAVACKMSTVVRDLTLQTGLLLTPPDVTPYPAEVVIRNYTPTFARGELISIEVSSGDFAVANGVKLIFPESKSKKTLVGMSERERLRMSGIVREDDEDAYQEPVWFVVADDLPSTPEHFIVSVSFVTGGVETPVTTGDTTLSVEGPPAEGPAEERLSLEDIRNATASDMAAGNGGEFRRMVKQNHAKLHQDKENREAIMRLAEERALKRLVARLEKHGPKPGTGAGAGAGAGAGGETRRDRRSRTRQ